MAEGFRRQPEAPFLRRAREALSGAASGEEPDRSTGAPRPADSGNGEPVGVAEGHGGSEVHRSVNRAAHRIQEILDAAERAADDIRAEAEEEAARYLEVRRREADAIFDEQAGRLDRVLDAFREQLAKIEADSAVMVATLEAAIAEARHPVPPPAAPVSQPVEPDPVPEPEPAQPERPEAEPAEEEISPAPSATPGLAPVAFSGTRASAGTALPPVESAPDGAHESALIRATQMAVRGSDREEIEAALREEFGLADPSPLVDEILGTG